MEALIEIPIKGVSHSVLLVRDDDSSSSSSGRYFLEFSFLVKTHKKVSTKSGMKHHQILRYDLQSHYELMTAIRTTREVQKETPITMLIIFSQELRYYLQ
jgi:hypothetical protein